MKKIMSTVLFLLALGVSSSILAQKEDYTAYLKAEEAKRKEKDEYFKSNKKSPLTKEQKEVFTALKYYDIDPKWKVEVEVNKLKNEAPFSMTFTDGKQYMYVKYCVLKFKVDGEECQLTAYRDAKVASKDKNMSDYLFIPFRDETNGNETFGGGRYLQWQIPKGKTDVLDFNNAFNPSCTYNIKTKCPIPPEENYLKVRIEAGEKDFEL